ncbi:glycosyltransferase family 2 protein [Methylobacterium marchantiae]|uniref:Glycosyltransferase family 2 protein n=1 Tax=Methylobacterium marchantiae TaxID=600331 RepID=A0ABW3X2E5_9HYPH|nr:hypothetical protein AIGOOFII_3173 [Methylobacterium marchantiae]
MKGRPVDLAVLALARDCAKTLPNFLRMIESLEAGGVSTFAIVGENGSRDATRALLVEAASRGLLRIEDTGFMSGLPRLERMARGREALAMRLRRTPVVSPLVCILDLDEPMSAAPDVASLRRVMARLLDDHDRFASAATSRPTYYDLLAFDDGSLSFDRLDEEIHARETNPFRYWSFFQKTIYPAQRQLTSDRTIPCVSAFNGLCLYKGEDFALGSYCDGSDFRLCEHLTFNRSVAAATGRAMAIDPDLVVTMPVEHGSRSFGAFWAQRVQKLALRLKSRVPAAS